MQLDIWLPIFTPVQWRSQNRVVARAQAGQHIRCCAMCGKLACGSMLFSLGGSGGMPPRENFGIQDLRDRICWVFRPSKCSENNTHLQYSGSALVAIQLSRKLMLVLNAQRYIYTYSQARPSDPRLFRSHADSFERGANLKLRQANARAQAKVARARARVCRGLATPLPLLNMNTIFLVCIFFHLYNIHDKY